MPLNIINSSDEEESDFENRASLSEYEIVRPPSRPSSWETYHGDPEDDYYGFDSADEYVGPSRHHHSHPRSPQQQQHHRRHRSSVEDEERKLKREEEELKEMLRLVRDREQKGGSPSSLRSPGAGSRSSVGAELSDRDRDRDRRSPPGAYQSFATADGRRAKVYHDPPSRYGHAPPPPPPPPPPAGRHDAMMHEAMVQEVRMQQLELENRARVHQHLARPAMHELDGRPVPVMREGRPVIDDPRTKHETRPAPSPRHHSGRGGSKNHSPSRSGARGGGPVPVAPHPQDPRGPGPYKVEPAREREREREREHDGFHHSPTSPYDYYGSTIVEPAHSRSGAGPRGDYPYRGEKAPSPARYIPPTHGEGFHPLGRAPAPPPPPPPPPSAATEYYLKETQALGPPGPPPRRAVADPAWNEAAYRSPAPLPTPLKLRDPTGRVFSFPYAQCKKWSDVQELIRGACGYLEKIGPAVMAGMYNLTEGDGHPVRPEDWEQMVAPGWELSLNIVAPPQPPTVSRVPEYAVAPRSGGHRGSRGAEGRAYWG